MAKLDKGYLYICDPTNYDEETWELNDSSWNVRKVCRETMEEESSYDVTPWKCACKGFENYGRCKHIGMITGTLDVDNIDLIPDESEDSVLRFLAEKIENIFGERNIGGKVLKPGDDFEISIAQKVEFICEDDKLQQIYLLMKVPFTFNDDDKKFGSVIVRVVFTPDFDRYNEEGAFQYSNLVKESD